MQRALADFLRYLGVEKNSSAHTVNPAIYPNMTFDTAKDLPAVTLAGGCAIWAPVKPEALTRCLDNLVSNALKYGGVARVFCREVEERIEIAHQVTFYP